MSVIPLSSVDPHTEAEKVELSDAKHTADKAAREASDARFDAAIEQATEHVEKRYEPVKQEKDLDKLIERGLEKYETEKEDRAAFEKSREARQELDARYAKFGGNTAKTLDLFLNMAEQLQANPQGAAQQIAESYLKASRYALDLTPEKKERPQAEIVNGERNTNKVLDHILEQSIEAGNDRETFEATKDQRARLKQLWPDLDFSQAMERIRQVDRNLHKDPLAAAAELGAAFGMPVLPHQVEAAQERHQADATVAHAARRLPGMQDHNVRLAMAEIIQDPNFVQSGNPQADLQRAYQIVGQQYQHQERFNNWAISQLQQIEKSDPALARATVDVLYKDRAFREHADKTTTGLVDRFHAATAWAQAKQLSAQRSVAKAKRALPVKSSSGAMPSGASGGDGLDGAIDRALSRTGLR